LLAAGALTVPAALRKLSGEDTAHLFGAAEQPEEG
jgi:hypothetical protein